MAFRGEIAAPLGVNLDTITKWAERKQMPAHKFRRPRKFKAIADGVDLRGQAVGDFQPD